MAVGITLDKERGLGDSVDDAVGGSAIGHSGQACERSLPGNGEHRRRSRGSLQYLAGDRRGLVWGSQDYRVSVVQSHRLTVDPQPRPYRHICSPEWAEHIACRLKESLQRFGEFL